MPATKIHSTAGHLALLEDLEGDLIADERPDLASLVHWRASADQPLHRWYRYREGFSPALIDALDLSGPILDPFSGCGSILIGAAQRDLSATGIDLNPLANFVTKVKLTPLDPGQLSLVSALRAALAEPMRSVEPWPLPGLSIASKAFEPEICDELLRTRALIEGLSNGNSQLRDFMLLGWISTLERVGSYFKEGNGLKYRNRRRTTSGYVKRVDGEWQRERFGKDQRSFVRTCLAEALKQMEADTAVWDQGAWSRQEILDGSALDMDVLLPDQEFASIIFSPPYANRFDYFEAMKVELWFGGFVETPEQMRALRKASMRSHLAADMERPWGEIAAVEQVIECMDRESSSWRMGVPDVLRGYFDDMATVLGECRRLLRPGGKCHVVVGNSAYAGTIVPTDVLIAKLGVEAAGFDSAEVTPVRHLTVAPQQRSLLGEEMRCYMRESLVTLW